MSVKEKLVKAKTSVVSHFKENGKSYAIQAAVGAGAALTFIVVVLTKDHAKMVDAINQHAEAGNWSARNPVYFEDNDPSKPTRVTIPDDVAFPKED